MDQEKGEIGPLLRGTKVFLDALDEADIPVLVTWYRDTEFLRNFDYDAAIPRNGDALKKMYLGQEDMTSRTFAIRETGSGELVGLCGLFDISFNNRFSWLSIGMGTHRGKGYGREALSLMVRFAFHELNLERLQLFVISYNKKAIALYESMGFQQEGICRNAILRDGKRVDLYLYGLLSEEWVSS